MGINKTLEPSEFVKALKEKLGVKSDASQREIVEAAQKYFENKALDGWRNTLEVKELAKELGLRRQNLNTIKNRILKRTKVEVENNKRRKI